ncbi:hypothetical protein CSUI_003521 [Cystoisospora suis]|uniref:Uncharacterized protein n=1 Tax=Cystoisospora suis TaxID=483139 RepID=A0A2C6KF48_9APIC|nr:hypothetical protein CSUI_003521 [Cystoisospora suis]
MQVAALVVEGTVVATSPPGAGSGCAAYSPSLSRSKQAQSQEGSHSPYVPCSPLLNSARLSVDLLRCTSPATRAEVLQGTEQLPCLALQTPQYSSPSPSPTIKTLMHSPAGRRARDGRPEGHQRVPVCCHTESVAEVAVMGGVVDTTSWCVATSSESVAGNPVRRSSGVTNLPKETRESVVAERAEGPRQLSLSTPLKVSPPLCRSPVSKNLCLPVPEDDRAGSLASESLGQGTSSYVAMGSISGDNVLCTFADDVVVEHQQEPLLLDRRPGDASCSYESDEVKECPFLSPSFRSVDDQVTIQSMNSSLFSGKSSSLPQTQSRGGGGSGNPVTLLLPIPTRRRDLKAFTRDGGEGDSSSEEVLSEDSAVERPPPRELFGPMGRRIRPIRKTQPPEKAGDGSLCPHLAKRVSFGSPLSVEVHQYSYADGSKISGGSVTSSQDSSNSSLGSLLSSPSTQCLLLPARENSSPTEECSFAFVRPGSTPAGRGGFLSPTPRASTAANPLPRSPTCLSCDTGREGGRLPLTNSEASYSPLAAEEETSYSDSSGCMTRRHSDTSGRGNDFPSFRLYVAGSSTPERGVSSLSPSVCSPVVQSPSAVSCSPAQASLSPVSHVHSCRRISPKPLLPPGDSGFPVSPPSTKHGGTRSVTPGSTTPSSSKHAHGLRLLVSSPTRSCSPRAQLDSPRNLVPSPTEVQWNQSVSMRSSVSNQIPDASPLSAVYKTRLARSPTYLVPQPRLSPSSASQRNSCGSPEDRPSVCHMTPHFSMDKTRVSSVSESPVQKLFAGPPLPVGRTPHGEILRETGGSSRENYGTLHPDSLVNDGEENSPFTSLCVNQHTSCTHTLGTSLSPENSSDVSGLQHPANMVGVTVNSNPQITLSDCVVSGSRNDFPKDFPQSPTASVSPSRPLASVRCSWCDVGFMPGRA